MRLEVERGDDGFLFDGSWRKESGDKLEVDAIVFGNFREIIEWASQFEVASGNVEAEEEVVSVVVDEFLARFGAGAAAGVEKLVGEIGFGDVDELLKHSIGFRRSGSDFDGVDEVVADEVVVVADGHVQRRDAVDFGACVCFALLDEELDEWSRVDAVGGGDEERREACEGVRGIG